MSKSRNDTSAPWMKMKRYDRFRTSWTAEIRHVAIGRRKYITRDDLKAFIEAHSQLGLAKR